jgi:hypothetical protein
MVVRVELGVLIRWIAEKEEREMLVMFAKEAERERAAAEARTPTAAMSNRPRGLSLADLARCVKLGYGLAAARECLTGKLCDGCDILGACDGYPMADCLAAQEPSPCADCELEGVAT